MTIKLETFAGPPLSGVWAALVRPDSGDHWSLFIPRSNAALPLLDTEQEYAAALQDETIVPVLTFHTYDDPALRQTWLGYIIGGEGKWTLFVPNNGGLPFLTFETPDPEQVPQPPSMARSNPLLQEEKHD